MRDCKHGHLARSCQTCELEAERDALKAELSEAHADCIQRQQEINCLRMQLCQLPHSVRERNDRDHWPHEEKE